jgi:hypothetical protein
VVAEFTKETQTLKNLLLLVSSRGFAAFALGTRQLPASSVQRLSNTNPTGYEKGRALSFDSDKRIASEGVG